jgi:hypothetical protein
MSSYHQEYEVRTTYEASELCCPAWETRVSKIARELADSKREIQNLFEHG